jgi:tRNA(Ile)-lysidine synthase
MKLLYPNQKFNRLGVAVSGGADSVALLRILLQEKDRFAEELIVYTVNHGIRGQEAERDASFVQDLCARLAVPCRCHTVNAPLFAKEHGLTLEEAARTLRYRVFDEAIAKGEIDAVATAHHSGDVAETVLFRLLRGSGVSGVAGVLNARKSVIRPLLFVTKEEICAFLGSLNQPYVTDSTNLTGDADRNFLRNEIFPALQTRFPAAKKQLAAFSSAAEEDEALLCSLAARYCKNTTVLPCESRPLFFRALICAMRAAGLTADYERAHLETAYTLQQKRVGTTETLPHGYSLEKTRGGITVSAPLTPYFEIPFGEGCFSLPCGEFAVKRLVLQNGETEELCLRAKTEKNAWFVDASLVDEGTIFRQKKEGDRILPIGKKTPKKVKDYFAAQKLSLADKAAQALLVNGQGTVLAVVGRCVAEQAKITPETTAVYQISRQFNEK